MYIEVLVEAQKAQPLMDELKAFGLPEASITTSDSGSASWIHVNIDLNRLGEVARRSDQYGLTLHPRGNVFGWERSDWHTDDGHKMAGIIAKHGGVGTIKDYD